MNKAPEAVESGQRRSSLPAPRFAGLRKRRGLIQLKTKKIPHEAGIRQALRYCRHGKNALLSLNPIWRLLQADDSKISRRLSGHLSCSSAEGHAE